MSKNCCDYGSCKTILEDEEGVYIEIGGETFHVCDKCEDEVVNNTGYCDSSCMLGGGCSGVC